MKSGKLFWQRKSSGKSTTDNDDHRGKYKPVRLVLAETDEDMKDRVEYVLSVHESAEPDSKLQLPTFISPRQRSLLRTTGCFLGACGCLGGGAVMLFVMGLANSLDGEEEQVPGADEPTTQVIEASDNCTLTYDPDDISDLMREAYVDTFFNRTCLVTNGTGDPCDLHIAEEYTYLMFRALRFERLVGEFLAFVAIFSFAQFGGIPRPTNCNGVLFWSAWMTTQLAQYVVILCALLLHVCSFLGVRARLAPCLVRVDGTALLDFYALCTFAVQPTLLVKVTMLFAYSFLLSLGMAVFDGSREWPWHQAAKRNWRQAVVQHLRAKRVEDASKGAPPSAPNLPEPRPQAKPDPSAQTRPEKEPVESSVLAVANDGADAGSSGDSVADAGAAPPALASPPQPTARFLQSRTISKEDYERDAAGPVMPVDKKFKARLSLALSHYRLAQMLAMGALFSVWAAAIGDLAGAPGVASAWVMAFCATMLTIAADRYALLSRRFGSQDPSVVREYGPLEALREYGPTLAFVVVACPLLSASAVLPLSLLFMLFVQMTYYLGGRVVRQVTVDAENGTQVWKLPGCLTRSCGRCRDGGGAGGGDGGGSNEGSAGGGDGDSGGGGGGERGGESRGGDGGGDRGGGCCKWMDSIAGATRDSLAWLDSTYAFTITRRIDGLLGRARDSIGAFTSTSYSTLAAALSCFWMLLAVAPCVSHAAWARAHAIASENAAANSSAFDEGDATSPAGGWSWVWSSLVVWLFLGIAVVLCCGIPLGRCLYIRTTWHSQLGILRGCLYIIRRGREDGDTVTVVARWLRISVPAVVLFIFTAAQHDDDRERLAITYASTFEGLNTAQLDINGLLPSLDELLDVLSDPAAALSGVAERIANLSSYADFDPSYFAQGVDALKAINVILSVIRLLATWGRKLFALVDLSKAMLQTYLGEEGSSDDDDDGIVKVHQTMTSVESMAILRFISKHKLAIAHRHGVESFDDLVRFDSLKLTDMGLTYEDIDGLLQLITHPRSRKLSNLNLGNNQIRAEGASALAAVLKETNITNLGLSNNELCGLDIIGRGTYTAEGITKLCEGLKGSSVTSLDLQYNEIEDQGAIALAEGLKGNSTLQSLNLCQNNLGPKGGAALAEGIKGNSTLQSLDLRYNNLNEDATKALRDAAGSDIKIEF